MTLNKLALQFRREKILMSPIWRHNALDLQKVSEGQKTNCLFCGTDLPKESSSSYTIDELYEVQKHFIRYTCPSCGASTWHHYAKTDLNNCLLTEAIISNDDYQKLSPTYGESYQNSLKIIHYLERKSPLTKSERTLLKNLKNFSSEVHKLHGKIRVYKGNSWYTLLEKGVHLSENPRKTIKEFVCEINHTQTQVYSDTPLHVGYHNVVKFENAYGIFDYKEYYEVDQYMLDSLIKDN